VINQEKKQIRGKVCLRTCLTRTPNNLQILKNRQGVVLTVVFSPDKLKFSDVFHKPPHPYGVGNEHRAPTFEAGSPMRSIYVISRRNGTASTASVSGFFSARTPCREYYLPTPTADVMEAHIILPAKRICESYGTQAKIRLIWFKCRSSRG